MKKRVLLFGVSVALLTCLIEPAFGFPQAVAQFILGRPITERSLEEQMGGLDAFTEPLMTATDAIYRERIAVGKPKIELSVLIIEPRHFGIKVIDEIEISETKKLSYKLSITTDEAHSYTAANKLLEELKAEQEDPARPQVSEDQIRQIIEAQVEAGGQIPSTEDPETLFLLLGYGVPKKAGLPLALLLANHGIRTIIPDLRGQGKSEGKGVTWGKDEPDDLSQLLTVMQQRGMIEEKEIAVLGVSYGATMAALWAAKERRIGAVILVAPYQQADLKIVEATESFLGDTKLPFKPKKETLMKGAEIAAKRLKTSWEDLSATRAIPNIPRPVLFLASSGDEIIPLEEVEELYEIAPEESKLHTFEHLPHMIIGVNFTEVEAATVGWLRETRFLAQ